jgi:hypothetical protein
VEEARAAAARIQPRQAELARRRARPQAERDDELRGLMNELRTLTRPVLRHWAEYLWGLNIDPSVYRAYARDNRPANEELLFEIAKAAARINLGYGGARSRSRVTVRDVIHHLATRTNHPRTAQQLLQRLKAILHMHVTPEASSCAG